MRNKNIKPQYKLIEGDLHRRVTTTELQIIKELEEKFSKKDLFFQINDSKIIFYLRSIDLSEFRSYVKNLTRKHKYFPKDRDIFSEIIGKIENIKSYGIKGGKRIYVGYNSERKVLNRQGKVLRRGSYFYARGGKFSREANALPAQFVNKIICGDSKEVLKKLPSNCIDLVFTSPPYNFGLEYDLSEDGINWDKYFEKLFAVFAECIRVLKYGGRIIVNIQPLYSDYIPIHHIISDFFRRNKFIWKGEIIWEKHNYSCKYTAWGSWKSPSNPYLKYTWEFLEVFCKGSLKKPGQRENIDITGDEFKKWVYGKWDIAPERNMEKFEHPAMFPEELVRRVLKLFSYTNDVVLDPFNGVGSTTVVAQKLHRKFLGIDISEKYCKIAKNRLSPLHETLDLFTE